MTLSGINKRQETLFKIQQTTAYVLMAGVILVVLQSFFCLTLLGKVSNTTSNNSHFMYYAQIYLKFCTMVMTPILLLYYGINIFRALDGRKYKVGSLISANLILIPLAIMLVWAFIAMMKSPDRHKSLYGSGYINEGFFTVLQYGVVFLSAYAVKDAIKRAKEAALWTFIISAGVICVIFVGIYAIDYSIPTKLRSGVFNNSNHFGYFLAMSTTATFGAFVYSKKIWQMFLTAILLPFNIFNLFYCNTLGANLAYIGGIIFIVCSGLITKKLDWRKLLFALGVSALFTLILEASGRTNMWASYKQLFVDIGNVLNPSSGGGSGGNSSAGTGRFGLWKRTISVIKKVPWFGKGLDLYYANNIYDSSLDVPHNEYLAIASNIGIPGLLMYLTAIVWWFVRAIVQKKHLKGFDLVLLATAFAYLISAFFGNSFTYTYPYFLVFFALSIQKDRPLVPKYVKLQSVNDEALSAGAV